MIDFFGAGFHTPGLQPNHTNWQRADVGCMNKCEGMQSTVNGLLFTEIQVYKSANLHWHFPNFFLHTCFIQGWEELQLSELSASCGDQQKASKNKTLMKTRNKSVWKGECSFCFKEIKHFPEHIIGTSEPKYLQIKKETNWDVSRNTSR